MSEGGWFLSGAAPVPVSVACLCPGMPHPDGDTVYLRAELDAPGGFGVTVAMQGPVDGLEERMGRAYLVAGIESWTFLDSDGKTVPCDREHIRRLAWTQATYELADKASDLYGKAVLDPLVAAVSSSLRAGPTAVTTSATRNGSSRRQRP